MSMRPSPRPRLIRDSSGPAPAGNVAQEAGNMSPASVRRDIVVTGFHGGALPRVGATILMLALATHLAGCAVTMNGTTQLVPVKSAPAGATVLVNGIPAGTTPCKIEVSRTSKTTLVRLEREGYRPAEVALTRARDTAVQTLYGVILAASLATHFVRPADSASDDAETLEYLGAGLLIGAAVGAVVDFGSGAIYVQQPQNLRITLEPEAR